MYTISSLMIANDVVIEMTTAGQAPIWISTMLG